MTDGLRAWRGKRSKAKAKDRPIAARAFANSNSWIACVQQEMGRRSGRLREQARSHKSKCKSKCKSKAKQSKSNQSSAAARGEAAPLNNERKLEYRF
ncbi:hypothetical protein ASG55_03775 [Pseudomonas sp. Leaf434]|nr:hypothetical protein ASG55_03775 [Pseudomonas sp. Leaf434]